ncbi:MAG: YdeI/OmpD-associated family protein [Gemmatimonadales bacterium]
MSTSQGLPIKRFASRAAWQTWLARHHDTSTGLWLELARKDSGLRSVSRAEALEVALCYGWIDGQAASVDASWWRQRFTPRRRRSRWSQINCAAVERLHAEGRLAPAGLREMQAAKRDGRWDAAYASPRAMPVPEDLQTALRNHPRARRAFEQLDGQNRYAILYRLHDAKKAETRERRLARFIRMLDAGDTLHQPRTRRTGVQS